MEDSERYERAMHRVQTGVAILIERNASTDTSPKHLRVGINSCLCDFAAVAKLLLEKGVFTPAEYTKAIADQAEKEAAYYRELVARVLGVPVEKIVLE